MDKLIHNQAKTVLFIDSILYFIILYDTANPINQTICIFKFKKSAHVLNSNLSRYFEFKTLQQTSLVLNSKNIALTICYKSNSLVDN